MEEWVLSAHHYRQLGAGDDRSLSVLAVYFGGAKFLHTSFPR